MATEQQNSASLTEIWAAFNRHLDNLVAALADDPMTIGIAAHVDLVVFSDDGHPMHRAHRSTEKGRRFFLHMRTRERREHGGA